MSLHHQTLRSWFIALSLVSFSPLLYANFGLAQVNPYAKDYSLIAGYCQEQPKIDLNSDKNLVPASTLKLLVSYAVLKKFHPGHVFKTLFYVTKKENSKELIIIGGGDPTLTTEQLYGAVNELKKRGVNKIDYLILDGSRFKDSFLSQGDRAYLSGTSALSINQNAKADFDCQPVYESFKSCSVSYRSVKEIENYFLEQFKTVASQLGITVSKLSFKSLFADIKKYPNQYIKIHEHQSFPLSQIIYYLNNFSTNMLANHLVFLLGEQDDYYSFDYGLKEIKRILLEAGIKQNFQIYDGSGLSTKNKISSKILHQLICLSMSDIKVFPEFISSLSIGGKTGTLKNRNFPPEIFLRAKTGMLNGVSSLAGFIYSKQSFSNGKPLVFAIIQNQVIDINKAKQWEESFVKQLYNSY